MYVRGEFWVVVDRIITDKPRSIDALWHWHPDCEVVKDKRVVKTTNSRGNLAVIPVSKQKFDISFVKGQEEPMPQGWYSPEYNLFEPNVATFYSTKIKKSSSLVWLLVPSENESPVIKTKVISENENGVEVEVKRNDKNWRLYIPYADSGEAHLSTD
jgi:hypothetical protein